MIKFLVYIIYNTVIIIILEVHIIITTTKILLMSDNTFIYIILFYSFLKLELFDRGYNSTSYESSDLKIITFFSC